MQEWILASRVAAPDELGLRMCGRAAIRPHPLPKGRVSKVFDVGTAVDAWWHDGWWEGIVVCRESDDKFKVYFPGMNNGKPTSEIFFFYCILMIL